MKDFVSSCLKPLVNDTCQNKCITMSVVHCTRNIFNLILLISILFCKVELTDVHNTIKDVYRLPVGIRKITWTSTQMYINNKPIYIRGVGKHEDSDVSNVLLNMSHPIYTTLVLHLVFFDLIFRSGERA